MLVAFIGLGNAQTGGGGGGPLTCQTNVTATPQMRGEGYTELTGDITLACTGGTSLPAGSAIPLANITILYNTLVTSRILPSNSSTGSQISEALLVVDASGCGIPASAQAHVLSVAVVPTGPLGYITMWPQGQPKPFVATLNASDAAITSNLALVPATNGTISVFASAPTHVIIDISGYFGQ